jgi:hypothetical protein
MDPLPITLTRQAGSGKIVLVLGYSITLLDDEALLRLQAEIAAFVLSDVAPFAAEPSKAIMAGRAG